MEVDPVNDGLENSLWKVTVRNDISGELDTEFFNAIMSCNGYVVGSANDGSLTISCQRSPNCTS